MRFQTTVAPAIIGLTQLCGQWLGSTTLPGAIIYVVCSTAWWGWMVNGRQWGFLPLNVVGLAVSSYTLLNLVA